MTFFLHFEPIRLHRLLTTASLHTALLSPLTVIAPTRCFIVALTLTSSSNYFRSTVHFSKLRAAASSRSRACHASADDTTLPPLTHHSLLNQEHALHGELTMPNIRSHTSKPFCAAAVTT